jgi:chemotaxis protein CheD
MTAAEEILLRADNLPLRVSLGQGEIYCSAEPRALVTVLGSCVAVCLWDRIRRIGGMNHFVLPSSPRGERNARYGDFATDELMDGLLRLGCRAADIQAKVFGGAAVLPFAGGESVGSNNVRVALERLHSHRIRVAVQRTGGTLGQQIRFFTKTGEVFFRYLPGNSPAARAAGGS